MSVRTGRDNDMQGHPHLFRRGNVYHWRRRSRRFSTGIVDIKLSLGTADLRTAHMLCRRISAESDIAMEQIVNQRITPEAARRWLSHVIRKERAKIEGLKMLRRVDSRDPEGDLRHDEATADALSHIRRFGLHAPPTQGDDTRLMRQMLDVLQADLTSETRNRIIAREFGELTGQDRLSAFDRVTVMNLLIAGKAAAWKQHDAVLDDIDGTADAIMAETSGFMGRTEASPEPWRKSSVATALLLENPSEITTTETGKPAATPGSDPDLPDASLQAIVRRMNEAKRLEKVEEKTLKQYSSFARLFTTLTGIDDIRHIRQNHVTAFRAVLHKLPKSWGKSPADQTATREEILARAARLPPEKIGLSVGTINRHLEHLGQIIECASDEGIPVDGRLKPTKLRRKDPVRDRDKKQAFTVGDLKKFFRTPVWTGSRSEHYQTDPGPDVLRNGVFWCPLIGAYTGARREEIAGLAPSDIMECDGILFFIIEDSDLRRVKNISSIRMIPIHSRLIELGFMDHVREARAAGQPDLFPGLREPKSGQHGRKLGRRMRQIIDATLGPAGEGLSFHSFRHYVQSTLEDIGVAEKVVRDIIGHEGKDTHQRNYSKPTPFHLLKEAIERLPVVDGG